MLCIKNQKGKIPFFDKRLLQATPKKNINSGNQFSLQLSPSTSPEKAEVGSVTPYGHWPRCSAENTGPAGGLWKGDPC